MSFKNNFFQTAYYKFLKFFPTPIFLNFSGTGIDFSTEGFRFVDFERDEKGFKLKKFGFQNILEKDFLHSEQAFSFLKKISDKKIKYVRVIVPEESSYLFILPIEGDEASARGEIEFHLEENVPLLPSNTVFDFITFSEDGKKIAVVTALSQDTVSTYVDFFEKNNIKPISFIPESHALAKDLIKNDEKGVVLIAHISKNKTVIAVAKNRIIRFSSAIKFGGEMITEAIAKYCQIPLDQAEIIKNEKGFSMKEENHDCFLALGNSISAIRDEIERVIIYWQTHDEKNGVIEKIIISGSNANMPGLVEHLSESLRIKTEKGDVWSNFPRYKDEVPEIPFGDSLSYAALLGIFSE
ncbi:MAG: pilus assembly protein PilM [Candidatus Paceibacterota bacterium]